MMDDNNNTEITTPKQNKAIAGTGRKISPNAAKTASEVTKQITDSFKKPVIDENGTVTVKEKNDEAVQNEDVNVSELFKSVYHEKKKEDEEKRIQDALNAQKEADEEILKGNNDIPVLSSEKAIEDKKNDKMKILIVFLIVFTIVLFLASGVYLLTEKFRKDDSSGSVSQKTFYSSDVQSVRLSSPFDYQQIYNVDFPEGIQEKYKPLYAQNTDFVGWLNVPGTSIDTPVYQTSDNNYYLKHDNFDTYTKYGIPYLDFYDGVQNLSRNSTIYGHNFENKLIFDEIQNYENVDFYKENPVIEFNTIYRDYKWKVIACFRSNGDTTGDNGYLFYYVAAEMGNKSFMEFYDEIMQRSYIKTDVDVQETDKILTLSTCTYFFDRNGSLENARFALVARLVRDGESEEVDTSNATENDNVRYPQLYYDVFGGTNPYRNASQWNSSPE